MAAKFKGRVKKDVHPPGVHPCTLCRETSHTWSIRLIMPHQKRRAKWGKIAAISYFKLYRIHLKGKLRKKCCFYSLNTIILSEQISASCIHDSKKLKLWLQFHSSWDWLNFQRYISPEKNVEALNFRWDCWGLSERYKIRSQWFCKSWCT